MAAPKTRKQRNLTGFGRERDTVARLLAAVMREPRSAKTAAASAGIATDTARLWLNSWWDMGIVYIKRFETSKVNRSRRTIYTRIFAITEGAPFSCNDAQKPTPVGLPCQARPKTVELYTNILDWMRKNPDKFNYEAAQAFGVSKATVCRALAWQRKQVYEAAKKGIVK